uniref:alcohol dehydrogenase catalytic domain-containing protein n=1 Tax=Sinomonas sp. G460-2 TaxID=3393464 RepID=UPI0039EE8BC5
MPQAVQFDNYGDLDVLEVREVPRPEPAAGEVLVRVRAAGISPGESAIRAGVLHDRWPATFPSGQGSDLAGVVEEVGSEVDEWSVGDEVIGWVDTRASHAELVAVPAGSLVPRDPAVSWQAGGALFVAG